MNHQRHIFLADPNPSTCSQLAQALTPFNTQMSVFASAEACLEALRTQPCDLLIADVQLPSGNGSPFLKSLRTLVPFLPVIVVAEAADVQTVASAFKRGVLDFLQKPLNPTALRESIELAFGQYPQSSVAPLHLLTEVERQLLPLILEGKSNTEMAYLLNRSVRAIEDRRAKIMKKLNAHTLLDLVKRVAVVRMPELTDDQAP